MTHLEGIRVRNGQDLAEENPVLLRLAILQMSRLLEGDKQVRIKSIEELYARNHESFFATHPSFSHFLGHISLTKVDSVKISAGEERQGPVVISSKEASSLSPVVIAARHYVLGSLIVHPENRHQDVGFSLVEAAVDSIQSDLRNSIPGEGQLAVVSALANEASSAVFQKVGILPEGTNDPFLKCLSYDLREDGYYSSMSDLEQRLSTGKQIVSRVITPVLAQERIDTLTI
jgi:ribosomal protein S18 acetylase RimI-like enzyme